MKASIGFAVCGALLLAACGSTIPVTGQMQRSDERFSGQVTGSGYRNGSGALTLVSNRHVTCKGDFVYTSTRRGEGVLSCDDGRTGPFHVVGVGSTGNGYGDLAGQRFTFTFGAQS